LNKDQAVPVPSLFDVANKNGRKTCAINWPCCTGAKTLDWMIPDAGTAELQAKFTTPGLVKEVAAAGIAISNLGKWEYDKDLSTTRDEMYAAVVCYLLAKYQTNVSLLHPITVDGVEHAYGPHTPEAYKAVADSDRLVKQIWATILTQPFADIAGGAGIQPGVQLQTIRNIDVAPTIARLLGLALPDSEGRVISEILIPVEK
jgi:hypothetical protein